MTSAFLSNHCPACPQVRTAARRAWATTGFNDSVWVPLWASLITKSIPVSVSPQVKETMLAACIKPGPPEPPGCFITMSVSQRLKSAFEYAGFFLTWAISFSVGLVCTPDGEAQAGVLQSRPATRPQIAPAATLHPSPVGGAGNLPPLHNIPSSLVV